MGHHQQISSSVFNPAVHAIFTQMPASNVAKKRRLNLDHVVDEYVDSDNEEELCVGF